MRMARKFRMVVLLKLKFRGHDPSGVRSTKQGECAVLCTLCPHSGIIILDNCMRAANGTKNFLSLRFAN